MVGLGLRRWRWYEERVECGGWNLEEAEGCGDQIGKARLRNKRLHGFIVLPARVDCCICQSLPEIAISLNTIFINISQPETS